MSDLNNSEKAKAFVTWETEEEKLQAFAEIAQNHEHYDGVQKASAYSRRSFIDIEPNRSVRTGFTRQDYDRFRQAEAVPKRQKEAIRMCMAAYDKVGIIRNVIDLMGDFAAQGITIVHPNKRIEKFYRKWFEKVGGIERSERFLNTLYRCGNVVVKRRTAKINKSIENDLKKSLGKPDVSIDKLVVDRRIVPWKYDFLNPLSVEAVGNELSNFLGKKQYMLKVSRKVSTLVNKNIDYASQSLPPDILKALKDGTGKVALDPDKVSVFHYKKDDWLVWANPMIYAILDDVIMLEKMKLADVAALDGAISNVRLWSLGDIDNKILPTKASINKLRNILASNVGGGTMDLVWGPELKFTESSTQVYRFLGKEKYEPVLTNIYAGLGVPPTLTGMANGSGGFTNNFISLKTLVERLQYGRDVLIGFWQEELERVRKAMGFRLPAKVHFDQMVLSDEASEKNLLIQLVDRNIISAETVVERFGEIPEIEKIRIKREERDRQGESMPQKASPYHNPQHRNDLEKIALQKDGLSPEDLGLIPSDETGSHPLTNPNDRRSDKDIEDKKEEIQDKQDDRDQKKLEQKVEKQEKDFDPTGRPEDGRPKNSRDKQKRKQREVKPRQSVGEDFVSLNLWASKAQKDIGNTLQDSVLSHYGKKNLRGLTKQQTNSFETMKLSVLCGMSPYQEVTAESIHEALSNNFSITKDVSNQVRRLKKSFSSKNDRQPNIDELRQIYASAYSYVFST
tara:strand:+ start:8042 stop:10252 length:2211 start_codon:yes stop_codon:yes gene_type:complete